MIQGARMRGPFSHCPAFAVLVRRQSPFQQKLRGRNLKQRPTRRQPNRTNPAGFVQYMEEYAECMSSFALESASMHVSAEAYRHV